MTTGLARFTAVLRQPAVATRFAPPPPPTELTALVAALGLDVPPEFHELYALCDGNAHDEPWSKHSITPEDGFALLSVAEVAKHKQLWDGLAREYLTQSEDERRSHFHYGFWNPAWIPIATSGVDDEYALATTPCFGGPAHQVIAFNYKGDTSWYVVAESLDTFLDRIAMLLVESAPRFGMSTGREIGLIVGELGPERFDRTEVPRPPERITARALIERAAADQGIAAQVLRDRVVAAATTAANELFGPSRVIEAQLDADAADVGLYAVIDVVDQVATPGREVAHADVAELGFELGDQMLVQLFFLPGDEDKSEEQDRSMGAALARDANLERATASWRERYLQVVTEALRPA